MAESIARHWVSVHGYSGQIEIDGAGTGGWHVGEEADARTVAVLDRHGMPRPSRARKVSPQDFERFDHIIAMDHSHLSDLRHVPGHRPELVSLLLNWDNDTDLTEVADPYYGGPEGFETMYRLIERAVDKLLTQLVDEYALVPA